ncbi:MAG: antibiotic biosynthesis monooxygenase [Bacteriovoracaceae bacterium]|nr:antibiotic biosynthesis monooxygenase [Bacteriovoracaceae bacterium]
MSVKVILSRKVRDDVREELTPLLIQLRNLAMVRPGYISGETLINMDDPRDFLVISTWKSHQEWNSWVNDDRRKDIQKTIDALLDGPTVYKVYFHG